MSEPINAFADLAFINFKHNILKKVRTIDRIEKGTNQSRYAILIYNECDMVTPAQPSLIIEYDTIHDRDKDFRSVNDFLLNLRETFVGNVGKGVPKRERPKKNITYKDNKNSP